MADIEEAVCTSCFMECKRGKRKYSNNRAFPCSDGLRRWAKENRNVKGNSRGFLSSVAGDNEGDFRNDPA